MGVALMTPDAVFLPDGGDNHNPFLVDFIGRFKDVFRAEFLTDIAALTPMFINRDAILLHGFIPSP
jgi:hypothetical protein